MRDEERGRAVFDDAGLVAARGTQTGEEDDGEEEEAQSHTHRTPRDQLHRQDLSVLKDKHTRI